MNNKLLQQMKAALERFTVGQKIALAAITALALFGILFLLVWANRPEFGLLYSNLDAADASAIVDDLKSSNIPYKLKDGGKTILVAKKDIYELRIKYAGQKLISSGTVGYELFDKNNLGMTDFMQKVNLKRAIEGELTKTINQIEAIQQSRVHLVMPEPALFEEQEQKATASVIIKLNTNAGLNRKQILGITHMVAGSVEGLTPDNVTIVDTKGNILTSLEAGDDDVALTNSNFELKQKVEKYIGQKAQSMLDQVLGKGNAIVKVSAELNFQKVRRTSETYDPDNTAVLSEERNEERSSRQDTTQFQRENVITNYQVNKTLEEVNGSVGDIERLSVAIFVNGIYQDDQYVPRSDEEMQKIADIVKPAVGFRADRKDQIVVHQLNFDRSFINQEQEALETLSNKEFRLQLVRGGLVALGGLLVLLMLRSLFRKFGGEVMAGFQAPQLLEGPRESSQRLLAGEHAIDIQDDIYSKKLSPEAAAKLQARDKVTKDVVSFAEQDPERSARVLRYWLLEN
ncbi:MAG: flagellar basal-body MS-ring/collar protein FliF [bacterium]